MSTAPAPDLRELEIEFCRLPEVKAARVVADEAGTPTEVHIVATPEKHAKQLVRDIQTVALAGFGIDLDRRIVSVVQLDDGSGVLASEQPKLEVVPGPEPRLRVSAVSVETSDRGTRVRVAVDRGDMDGTGEALGPPSPSLLPRLAADAALAAVRDLEPLGAPVAVDVAVIADVGGRKVATVAVVCSGSSTDDVLTGSAMVRSDEASAVARAVLDALNRRLPALR